MAPRRQRRAKMRAHAMPMINESQRSSSSSEEDEEDDDDDDEEDEDDEDDEEDEEDEEDPDEATEEATETMSNSDSSSESSPNSHKSRDRGNASMLKKWRHACTVKPWQPRAPVGGTRSPLINAGSQLPPLS